MRKTLINNMKKSLEINLKNYLDDEGIDLYVAANDNYQEKKPHVILEKIEDSALAGNKLLSEIRIILRILGKPWQCDTLVNGIYYALHPHHLSLSELTVLLMSIHVENPSEAERPHTHKKAVMRYIVGRK